MRVLVTGGAGFIGSHFAKRLRAAGEEVRVLDKLTYSGNPANLEGTGAELVVGDICDAAVVAEAAAGCDAIVNFAAETHVDRSILEAGDFISTDVYGTHVLLEQHLRPEELCPAEVGRAQDRPVDVRLGGEVDDRVEARSGVGDGLGVADVALDQLDPRAVEVRRVARIGQLVEHAHVVARGPEPFGEVRADEAGATGDEHAHRAQVT